MNTQGSFTISTPCHENWNKMTAADQGRFCAACQKCVVDLTDKKPAQIQELYQQHGGDMCGRMRVSQMPRRTAPKPLQLLAQAFRMNRLQRFALAFLTAFGIFAANPTQAQSHVKMGIVAYEESTEITGTAKWDQGGPASGVTVVLEREGVELGRTTTDDKGRYTFRGHYTGMVSVWAYSYSANSDVQTFAVQRGGNVRNKALVMYDEVIMGDIAPYEPEPEPIIEPTTEPVLEPMEPEGGTEDIQPQTEALSPGVKQTLTLQDMDVTVYPNPGSDKILVVLSSPEVEHVEVNLTDMDGQQLYSAPWKPALNPIHTIPVMDLSTGIYLVELKGETGEAVQRRFVKE